MASSQEELSFSSVTVGSISRYIICLSVLVSPLFWVLVAVCFQSLSAAIRCLFQRGSVLWRRSRLTNNECSFSSEVHDKDDRKPYAFSSDKDLKDYKPSTEFCDRYFAFESESMKTVEFTADICHVRNRFDLQDNLPFLKIQDIVLLLANDRSKNLDIAAVGKKEDASFLQGFALPSLQAAGDPGFSSRRATDFADGNVNLTAKATKVPEEHIDWLCIQQEIVKRKKTSCNENTTLTLTKEPSDAEATQDKTSDSGQQGSTTPLHSNQPATQGSQCLKGNGNSSTSHSGSGGGGNDGDDHQKTKALAGGYHGGVSCHVADSEESGEEQPEEPIHEDDDYSHNQDSVTTPAKAPSDIGSTQTNNASNPKEPQMSSDGSKSATQASGKGSTNSHRNSLSSGSGGDDGDDDDDDRRRNVPVGGCRGDGQCKDEREKKAEELCEKDDDDDDDDDDDLEENSPPQMSDGISVGRSAVDGAKKTTSQALKINISGARMVAQGSFDLPDLQTESQGAACGSSLIDQFNCRHPEAEEQEHVAAESRLRKASACRHNINCESEWEKCDEAACREIQEFLEHSQKCRKRVLGGCDTCIQYKNVLLFHASRCHLPLGQCIVPKCDYIREYTKKHRIPENKSRKWSYQHDNLFFRHSPPTTPTAVGSEPSFVDTASQFNYDEFVAQLEQAEIHEEANILSTDYLVNDENSASFSGEAMRESSGAWNQYHVDRPPEVQVTRGPIATEYVKEQREDSVLVESAAPSIAVRDTSRTARSSSQEERGEIIWPLNKEKLSVQDNETYLENLDWRTVRFIGGGQCGRCFLCRDLHTGFLFAVKKIPVGKFEANEIEIWGSLSGQHPNILELYGAVKYSETVIIFMEYMSGGSVQEYAGRMTEFLAVHILGKVISAVEFMHSRRILHRDIKGGNVLLDETGHIVKLADFGTSVRCDSYLQDNSPRGTEAFMAPEVCRSEYHSFSADIWSIMCLLHQMLAGKPPWMEFCHGSLLFKIGTASQPPQSPPCSPEVENFFSQGFILEPTERATAAELLRHQVFMSVPYFPIIQLPAREEPELDYDEDSDTDTSSDYTESLVSEDSAGPLETGCDAAGNCNKEEEKEDDDEADSDISDDIDHDSNHIQEPDLFGGVAFADGPWQGLELDLSAEEQLQSLQSDLFLSLDGNQLENLMNEITEECDLSDNDVNLLNTEEFNVDQLLGQILVDADMASTQPMSAAFAAPEWSYSITDLTKLHIKDSNGNLLFTIREKPTTTYGGLGEEHHGNIASVLQLDAFTLTLDDGTPLNVRAEIGSEEQSLRVVRAHDTDNWQSYRWRVDVYGRVEQHFEF